MARLSPVLALALVGAGVPSLWASSPVIRWEETPTHRIKLKLLDGQVIGRWSFPKKKPGPVAPQPEPEPERPAKTSDPESRVVWKQTDDFVLKIEYKDGLEVGRWKFPRRPEPGEAPGVSERRPSLVTSEDTGTWKSPQVTEWIQEAEDAFGAKNYVRATELYLMSLERIDTADTDPLEVAQVLLKLGRIYNLQGRSDQARPYLFRAMNLYQALGHEKSPASADVLVEISRLYAGAGASDQAELHLIQALEILEEFHGPDHAAVGNVLYLLGLLQHERGDLGRAEEIYRKALATFLRADASFHHASILTHRFLARLLREVGRRTEAEGHERKAQELARGEG